MMHIRFPSHFAALVICLLLPGCPDSDTGSSPNQDAQVDALGDVGSQTDVQQDSGTVADTTGDSGTADAVTDSVVEQDSQVETDQGGEDVAADTTTGDVTIADVGSEDVAADVPPDMPSRECPANRGIGPDDECSVCVAFVSLTGTADAEDGTTWASAFTGVQSGIDAAAMLEDCEVWVAEGIYYTFDDDDANTVALAEGSIVVGGFEHGELTRASRDPENQQSILSGYDDSEMNRVLHTVTGAAGATLIGLTITGGSAREDEEQDNLVNYGGGLFNTADDLSLEDCLITGNEARYGGGAYNEGDGFTVTRTSFVGNEVWSDTMDIGGNMQVLGGGLYTSGNTEIVESVFRENVARGTVRTVPDEDTRVYGGGLVAVDAATLTLYDTTFEGNQATMDEELDGEESYLRPGGGALSIYNVELVEIELGAFIENRAQATSNSGTIQIFGGAIYASSVTTLDARGVLFKDNLIYGIASGDGAYSTLDGGAFYAYGGLSRFTECHFEGNTARATSDTFAEANGGAISGYGYNLVLASSIFSGNEALSEGIEGDGEGGAVLVHLAWDNNWSRIVNSVFVDNVASGATEATGGAVTVLAYVDDNLQFEGVSSTFVGNTATVTDVGTSRGGAVRLWMSGGATNSSLEMANSIFWQNEADEAPHVFEDGVDAVVSYSYVPGYTGGDNGNIDTETHPNPQFVSDNPESRNLGLAAESPCIDAGSNAAVPTDETDLDEDENIEELLPIDINGSPRFTDVAAVDDTGQGDAPIVDIGAHEREAD